MYPSKEWIINVAKVSRKCRLFDIQMRNIKYDHLNWILEELYHFNFINNESVLKAGNFSEIWEN